MSIVDEMQRIFTNSPPKIRCSNCGEELEIFDVEVDHNLNIELDINPCDCTQYEDE